MWLNFLMVFRLADMVTVNTLYLENSPETS